jgi:flagellar basal-body rod protein FlgB
MDLGLNVLALASRLAAHAGKRQEVISANVAHADTPGYRARDLADFAESLDAGAPFAARTTRAGICPSAPTRAASRPARWRPSARRSRTATP